MKRILIIIDMQKDFTNGVLGNAECEAAVQKIANIVKQESYDFICLTRDTHYDNYLETQEGKKLPVAHCIKDTDGWQIREEIMNAVSQKYRDFEYKIIDKESFGSLLLGQFLKQEYQSEELEIHFAGVCTGICVISNVNGSLNFVFTDTGQIYTIFIDKDSRASFTYNNGINHICYC